MKTALCLVQDVQLARVLHELHRGISRKRNAHPARACRFRREASKPKPTKASKAVPGSGTPSVTAMKVGPFKPVFAKVVPVALGQEQNYQVIAGRCQVGWAAVPR